jgi:hypothetical protein
MKHKTSHVHGPARIVLSSKLKSWLSIFVEVMRPQIASATSGNVFLSWNGREMISGHITKAVQSVFKKSGTDVKVTSTSFRKAAVTAVHSGKPTLSGKLARHMAHSEATAKKYYLLAEKTKESVEASKELGEIMRCDGEERSESEKNDEKDECKSRINEEEAEDTASGRPKRVEWTDGDLEKVKATFGKDIAARVISMDRVRDGIEKSTELHSMSPRRVYDKIIKLIKEEWSSKVVLDPPQDFESLEDKLERFDDSQKSVSIPDDQLSISIVAPSERNSNFTNDEMNSLHKLFDDMITQNRKICRIEIQKRLSSNKEGEKLLKKLSVFTVLNRIKYERRKARDSLQIKKGKSS